MELKIRKAVTRRRIYDTVICLALLSVIAALVLYPEESVKAGSDGVRLCLNIIIPPCFHSCDILNGCGAGNCRLGWGALSSLYDQAFQRKRACSAAFVLGFIGGYPVGAKRRLRCMKGQCAKPRRKGCSASNNSGPAFILGVVGAGVFSNSFAGLLLYLAHTVASVIVGILFRNWGNDGPGKRKSREAS